MRALHSPQARRIAVTWTATLLLGGVGLFATVLDPAARQQLRDVVRALALGPADYKVADPVPTLDSPAPLRTH